MGQGSDLYQMHALPRERIKRSPCQNCLVDVLFFPTHGIKMSVSLVSFYFPFQRIENVLRASFWHNSAQNSFSFKNVVQYARL